MEIEKRYIEPILLQLEAYDVKTGKPYGLLFENISLGLRRKLQKINKWLLQEYRTFMEELKEAKAAEDSSVEVEKLLAETVKSDLDYALIAEIDKIQTDKNYKGELIEMIAQ